MCRRLFFLFFLISFSTFVFSQSLTFSGGKFSYGSLIEIVPFGEVSGSNVELSKQEGYSINGNVVEVGVRKWKFSNQIRKPNTFLSPASTPSKLGWKITSSEKLTIDNNTTQRFVWGGTFSIDFQDLHNAGFVLNLKQASSNEVFAYAVGNFTGENIILDPTLEVISINDLTYKYASYSLKEPKFILRNPDNNVVFVFLKDGNLFYTNASGTVATRVPVGKQCWVNMPYYGVFLTRVSSGQLILAYEPENQPTEGVKIGVCRNNFSCQNTTEWGINNPIPYNGGFSGLDANEDSVFFLTWDSIFKVCNASASIDCNVSSNWVTLASPNETTDPAGITAKGKYVWVVTQTGKLKVYNSDTGSWSSALNPPFVQHNYTMISDSNGNLYYALQSASSVTVFEFVANPISLKRLETLTPAGFDGNINLAISDSNVILVFEKNNANLYYVTRRSEDENFSSEVFVQSNCSMPRTTKYGFNGFVDYTCWNPSTSSVDVNYFKLGFTPPSSITPQFDYYLSPPAIDYENGISIVTINLTDTSLPSSGGTISEWNWFKDGNVLFATTQNASLTTTSPIDLNITLKVRDENGDANITKLISVRQAVQGLSVIPDSNYVINDKNIIASFRAVFNSGSAEHYYWQIDSNYIGVDNNTISYVFNTIGDKNVCVTIKTLEADYNKTSCTSFRIVILRLINEDTGQLFDLNKLTSARVFTYDGNFLFDLKDKNITSHFFLSNYGVLRFDFTYPDASGIKISREIDFDFIPTDNNIGVCVAEYQYFYEQILESALVKNFFIYNPFAKCYNIASSTKFAYKNVLANKAFTVAKPYYVYVVSDDEEASILTNIDGTIASEINLDVLEFNKTGSDFEINNDFISFGNKFSDGVFDVNVLQIMYENTRNTNKKITIKIYASDFETLIFETIEESNPNLFLLNWNFSEHNISDANQLKLIIVCERTSGEIEEIIVYFNTLGDFFAKKTTEELINYSVIAIVLSFFLIIFGFTFVGERLALGWFGVLVCIIALAILSISSITWQVKFFSGIIIIILVYVLIVWKNENMRLT